MQGSENGREAAANAAARRAMEAKLAAAKAAEERAVAVMALQAEKSAKDKVWKVKLEKAKQQATTAYHALQEARNVLREDKERLRRGQQQLTFGRLGNPELQAELEVEVEQLKSKVVALELAEKKYEKDLAEARQLVSEAQKALGFQ